jgi:hypothetical protein
MGGMRTAHRRFVRRIPSSARKRIAAVLPRRVLASYRHRRTDAYLVSFPKCGRTWLRVMIGRAFQLHYGLPPDADLVELHRLAELDPRVPCVVATHDDAQWKAPEDVAGDMSRFRGKRVVLLVRDPRDVIVSLYHQRRGRHGGYEGSLSDFLDERIGGYETLLRFYDRWAEHVSTLDVLVVRYEDVHARPDRELQRVLRFIGVDVGADIVADAVAFGSFDHMRELEEAVAFPSEKLRPGRHGDVATYKTRRGKVGGHQDELTPVQIGRLDQLLARSAASRFGYRPTDHGAS